MRVAFVVLDGLPPRHVGPTVTPTLASLAAEGAATVGRAVMASSTYPNHATFATGARPAAHGLVGNWVVTAEGPRPAQVVGPRGETIFDACRAGGHPCAAVLGDQHLVRAMRAAAADHHWPPEGVLPPGTAQDDHGYAADREVEPQLVDALSGAFDLVVGHLNEPDTAGHDLGPDTEAAAAVYRATDAVLGRTVAALRPRWRDTVLVVVSDHDLETVDLDRQPVDLYAPIGALGLDLLAIPEGGAAVVWGDDPLRGEWLDGIDGVAGHAVAFAGARVVWGAPGRAFAMPPGLDLAPMKGQHGGATTRGQVVVVAGGHPAAGALAAAVTARRPAAEDWAPTLAAMLGLSLAGATGTSLV